MLTFVANESANVVVRTQAYSFDTLVYARAGDCEEGAELACNDDAPDKVETESEVAFETTAGERIFIFVDGFAVLPAGATTALTLSTE